MAAGPTCRPLNRGESGLLVDSIGAPMYRLGGGKSRCLKPLWRAVRSEAPPETAFERSTPVPTFITIGYGDQTALKAAAEA